MAQPLTVTVTTASELSQAITDGVPDIAVSGTIIGMPMITLRPGTSLHGGRLRFSGRGVRVTTDNTLHDIEIDVPDTEAAILTDTTVPTAGTLTLRSVTTAGQVSLIFEDALRSGHVIADAVHVARADLRGRYHRPHAFGVDALQGAFTLWNRQQEDSTVTAELTNLSAGTAHNPVRGSGIFVGGSADISGRGIVKVSVLTTGSVESDGGIADGAPDVITGGVFVATGAFVERVVNQDSVTTYGQNDMVLDNWGTVGEWTANAPVTSHGPSGVGFVNFGDLHRLTVTAPIETFGAGSRGFNLYDGSLRDAAFDSIATHGDGAVGVQLSQPLNTLHVHGDITTEGGIGMSLVKGVQMSLRATALSVKEGGVIDALVVDGTITAHGDNTATVEVDGEIRAATIAGGIRALGTGGVGLRTDKPVAAFDDIDGAATEPHSA